MSDKPLAVILTTLIAAPLVIVCCGGTALIVPLASGFAAWFGGFDPVTAIFVALITAGTVVGIRKWRKPNLPTIERQADEAGK